MNTKSLNPRERYVYNQLRVNKWQIYRHGWLDFLAIKCDKVRLIEVKSQSDKLSKVQKRMHKALLKAFNISIDVVCLDEKWAY